MKHEDIRKYIKSLSINKSHSQLANRINLIKFGEKPSYSVKLTYLGDLPK